MPVGQTETVAKFNNFQKFRKFAASGGLSQRRQGISGFAVRN